MSEIENFRNELIAAKESKNRLRQERVDEADAVSRQAREIEKMFREFSVWQTLTVGDATGDRIIWDQDPRGGKWKLFIVEGNNKRPVTESGIDMRADLGVEMLVDFLNKNKALVLSEYGFNN